MARMSHEQVLKAKELNENIKVLTNELKELQDKKLDKIRRKKKVPKTLSTKITNKQGVLSALFDTLVETKRNRLGSKHYEFKPTGTNRRQQRARRAFN